MGHSSQGNGTERKETASTLPSRIIRRLDAWAPTRPLCDRSLDQQLLAAAKPGDGRRQRLQLRLWQARAEAPSLAAVVPV